ncbi:hypothetical protein A2U01_0079495 [Trifolium medium]|uniref:Uncharacterized protein n=1 Tax=Trifolium medium TaxID=97028 RepID=A0A392TAU4_9FABA|nr:hypothetical protein [Trifolium medium]
MVTAPRARVSATRAELCFWAGCVSVSCARLVLRRTQTPVGLVYLVEEFLIALSFVGTMSGG